MSQVPGVPPLLNPDQQPDANPPPLTGDTTSTFGPNNAPQWGLFKDGVAVITADSVISFGYKQDWTVSDYSVENGGFESYDKVQLPFNVRLRFATGGSDADRQKFLQSVAAIAGDLLQYDATTPEFNYLNVNVTHYDFDRASDKGVGLLAVDIWCIEIRENATATFTQTKAPSGANPVNTGNVQTRLPTNQELDFLAGHGAS